MMSSVNCHNSTTQEIAMIISSLSLKRKCNILSRLNDLTQKFYFIFILDIIIGISILRCLRKRSKMWTWKMHVFSKKLYFYLVFWIILNPLLACLWRPSLLNTIFPSCTFAYDKLMLIIGKEQIFTKICRKIIK